MRSEELQAEVAGIVGRLGTRLQRDPRFAQALLRDTEENSVQTTLEGIEEAILGLVMLHIQVRQPRPRQGL